MVFLFGYCGNSIERIAEAITSHLNVQPELGESSFRGGDYWLYRDGDEQAILQTNNDGGPSGEPAEEDFKEWPVLLYVEPENESGIVARLVQATIQPVLLCVRKF